MNTWLRMTASSGAVAALALAGVSSPAIAAERWTLQFDGYCDFPLVISGSGEQSRVIREFDTKGRAVSFNGGTGEALVWENGDTGKSLSTRANGAVGVTQRYADGSEKLTLMGHNAVLLSGTDVGGPSVTLYNGGRVVITIDAQGSWTVVKETGVKVDICAALS